MDLPIELPDTLQGDTLDSAHRFLKVCCSGERLMRMRNSSSMATKELDTRIALYQRYLQAQFKIWRYAADADHHRDFKQEMMHELSALFTHAEDVSMNFTRVRKDYSHLLHMIDVPFSASLGARRAGFLEERDRARFVSEFKSRARDLAKLLHPIRDYAALRGTLEEYDMVWVGDPEWIDHFDWTSPILRRLSLQVVQGGRK